MVGRSTQRANLTIHNQECPCETSRFFSRGGYRGADKSIPWNTHGTDTAIAPVRRRKPKAASRQGSRAGVPAPRQRPHFKGDEFRNKLWTMRGPGPSLVFDLQIEATLMRRIRKTAYIKTVSPGRDFSSSFITECGSFDLQIEDGTGEGAALP